MSLLSVALSSCVTSYKPPIDNFCANIKPVFIKKTTQDYLAKNDPEALRTITTNYEEWASRCGGKSK